MEAGEEGWGRTRSAGGAEVRSAVADGKGNGDKDWVGRVRTGKGRSKARTEVEMAVTGSDSEGSAVVAAKDSRV